MPHPTRYYVDEYGGFTPTPAPLHLDAPPLADATLGAGAELANTTLGAGARLSNERLSNETAMMHEIFHRGPGGEGHTGVTFHATW